MVRRLSYLFCVVAMAVLALCILPTQALADPSEGWNELGTCEWQIDGDTLTIRPLANGEAGTLPNTGGAALVGAADAVQYVVFAPGVSAGEDLSGAFMGYSQLKSINLTNLDTTATQDMSGMFDGCTSLWKFVVGNAFVQPEDNAKCFVPQGEWRAASDGQIYAGADLVHRVGADTYVLIMADVANATVKDIEAQVYTGEAIEPKVEVTVGGVLLTEGTHYTLSYANNIGVGTAYVKITGIGVCKGETTVAFSIIHAPGWAEENGYWYFYDYDGSLYKNRFYTPSAGETYYFDNEGRMLANAWHIAADGSFYYFDADGRMVINNWVVYRGKYYYCGTDGRPVINNWVKYNGSYYYLGLNGRPYVNRWLMYGGSYYYFGADGKLVINGVAPYRGKYYYLGSDARAVKVYGWKRVDIDYYYFGSDGTAYTNRWFNPSSGVYYYFGNDGKLTINGWATYAGKYYYMGSNGRPLRSTSIVLGSTKYFFDSNGVCYRSVRVA